MMFFVKMKVVYGIYVYKIILIYFCTYVFNYFEQYHENLS
jgi:hypothetical protein